MSQIQAQAVLFSSLTCANGRRIAIATLNAEKTLNALSDEMVKLLSERLQAWEADASIAMVILDAAGEKAFCAGGDLQNLYASMRNHHASDARADLLGNSYALNFFAQEYKLDYLIHTYSKPILCWGHGIVMGGGIGLMAGASHRVVTEKSRLAMPESAIGLFPDVGGSWIMPRMPGKLGLFLALTGAAINAADAVFCKLADYYFPHAEKTRLLEHLQKLDFDADLASNHRLLSQALQEQQSRLSEPGPLRTHFDTINHVCASANLAKIVDTLKHLHSDDAYLQKAATSVQRACPASLWLAYALQVHCHHLSLAEVFRVELVAALRCAQNPDFTEGIRALLIDKDQKPVWQHADLGEQTQVWRQGFFDHPWSADTHPLRDLSLH